MKWALFCVLSCTIWCCAVSEFDYGWYNSVAKKNCDVKATGAINVYGSNFGTFEYRSHGDTYWMFILDGEVQYLNRPDLNGFLDCTDGCNVTSQTQHFLHFSYTSSESASGCSSSSTSCRKYKSTGGSDQYYIADGQGFVWSIFEEGILGTKENEYSFQRYDYGTGLLVPQNFTAPSGASSFTQSPSSSDFYGLCGTDPSPLPSPEPSSDPPSSPSGFSPSPEPSTSFSSTSPEPSFDSPTPEPSPVPSSGTYNSVSSQKCSVKASGKVKSKSGLSSTNFTYQSVGGGYWKLLVNGELTLLNRPDLGALLDCTGVPCKAMSSVPSFLDIRYSSYSTSFGCLANSSSCKKYTADDGSYLIGDDNGQVWEYEAKRFWPNGGGTFKFTEYSSWTNVYWTPEDFTSSRLITFEQPPSSSDFRYFCEESGVLLRPLLFFMAAALWLLMHH